MLQKDIIMFNIYITHYDVLVERKRNLIAQLTNLGYSSYEFISNKGQNVITNVEKSKFRNIKISEISLFLHHIEVLKKIADPLNTVKYNLVLEDDVILSSKFNDVLTEVLPDLPDDWDMFFIGNGANLHVPASNDKRIYKVYGTDSLNFAKGPTRCTDSIFISKKCATLALSILPDHIVTLPYDHWLNWFIKQHNLNIYWLEPTIVQQGTEMGVYKSSIQHTQVYNPR